MKEEPHIYKWRHWAHEVMDGTWKSGLMTRKEMYRMLRQQGLIVHIKDCSVNECKLIIATFNPELVQEYENRLLATFTKTQNYYETS